jgi:hypothetical protein
MKEYYSKHSEEIKAKKKEYHSKHFDFFRS